MNTTAALRVIRADQKSALRTVDISALRADGSRSIDSVKIPDIPLFESAFSAFSHGVNIATPHGTVAIEDLLPGDFVNTSTGEPAEVVWIGSSSFVPAEVNRRMPLIRIMADSFGEGRPSSFVTVGPGARLLQTPSHLRGATGGSQMLTPVREFVDNVNVIEVTPPTPIRLFHIVLSRHAAVNVGGMMMETFHPGMAAAREVTHAQRDLFLSMFPRISHITDFGPLAHPRAPASDMVA